MVRPSAFGYNPQTAESNAFQKELDLSRKEISKRALQEFDQMAGGLKDLGIEVLIANDKLEPHTPDAVFPNNWFSTHPDGTFCLYPMEAKARRLERESGAVDLIRGSFRPRRIIDLTRFEQDEKFLEGTGSLILDHDNGIAYACISSRTNPEVLDKWAVELGFDVIKFSAFDENGTEIYHTNVMMCLGDSFAVICLESIANKGERNAVVESLKNTGKEIINISFTQLNNFAGNMLLLKNDKAEKILVMSTRARDSLNPEQIATLETHSKLASFDIETIEDCGGGSARCIIAEIF
ncbi:MAG: amidinotransferase [Pyrinomonadaceae bacterium]|nr:amidinotransferase [Pyrinomonadaceae bacterium]